ncbi:PAS domain S-box protein [Dyadobacter flavalbus]|uniref:histidine kinase n=1 Tax=Dyadobacter flavalbus TaxID=2579942 RepID=A0A5M8QY62_9BACT|nr:PAS domain S-box protein [Dyadobacter flavalbus]KAA6440341.1 PAS domain S-box protein [Dyadobacter flavalbus]
MTTVNEEVKKNGIFDLIPPSVDQGHIICKVLYNENDDACDLRFLDFYAVPESESADAVPEIVGKTVRELYPETASCWIEKADHASRTKQQTYIEYYTNALKHWFDVYFLFTGSKDEDHVSVIFRNVTGQKQNEAVNAFLLEVQDSMAGQDTAEKIAHTAGEKIGSFLDVAFCQFLHIEYTLAEWELLYQWHTEDGQVNHEIISMPYWRDEAFRHAARAGKSIVFPKQGNEPEKAESADTAGKELSYVAVPFHRNDALTFVLIVGNPGLRNWQPFEIKLIEESSARVFPHLERALEKTAMKEKEALTQIVVDTTELATWEWNLIVDEINWNKQHFELLGMEPKDERVKSEAFLNHIYPDDKEFVTAELAKSVHENLPFSAEFRIVRDDNIIRWMSGYGRVTQQKNGVTTHMSGVMLDITERKQTEITLRNSEERLRKLINDVKDYALFMISTDGIIIEWSPGAEKIKGYTDEEIIGKHFSIFYTPEEIADSQPEKELAKAMAEGHAETEGVRVRKSGERFLASEVVTAVYNINGKLTGFSKIARDIGKHRQVHRLPKQPAEQFRSVVNSISEYAIIIYDTGNYITDWNPGAQIMFGFTPEEAIGQFADIIYTDEDKAAGIPEKEILAVRKEGRAVDERYHVRKDQSQLYVSGIMSPLYNKDGKLAGYVKVARDLTERKKMEQTLKDADRRKDEFMAMLGHELRNPLAPIRNILQILKLTHQNDEALNSSVDMMMRQVDHIVHLVNDLLDMSRINNGKINFRPERTDLVSVTKRAIEMARPMFQAGNRVLTVHLPEESIYIDGDITRIIQIINNLLSNGVKYTLAEGRVILTLERVEDEAVLSVKDNGVGIAREHQNEVFETFVQINATIDRSMGGLGLGLSMVKQLVGLHGGSVKVISAGLGTGSEFIVKFPVID